MGAGLREYDTEMFVSFFGLLRIYLLILFIYNLSENSTDYSKVTRKYETVRGHANGL